MVETTEREPYRADSDPAAVSTGFNVLAAYDGSDHAQAALTLARELFGTCSAVNSCRLTAMTVLPTQAFAAHESLQKSLNAVEEQMSAAGLPVKTILKSGSPAVSLIEYADETGANLIMIGAQGLRATLGVLLGGTAQQVVEYANVPVLVVRAPYTGMHRLLVVDDGSWHGRHTIDYLAPLCGKETQAQPPVHHPRPRIHGEPAAPPVESARRRCTWLPDDIEITVMHVLQPSVPPEMINRYWTLGPEVLYPAPLTPMDFQALESAEEAAGREVLKHAKQFFTAAGMKCETVLRRGDVATEIIRYARENHIDLVACGSRGLNPVVGWLMGSVSRKLVHYAPCSVLVVK